MLTRREFTNADPRARQLLLSAVFLSLAYSDASVVYVSSYNARLHILVLCSAVSLLLPFETRMNYIYDTTRATIAANKGK